jgi:hypothetical protein
MSDGRNNYKDVYNRAALSSFTQKEFDFAKSGYADRVQTDNTDFTIVNRDSSGKITGYSYKNLPGLTSNGKPTEETTNFLLNNGKINTEPGNFRLEITINGKKTSIPLVEVGSMIRERHGMSDGTSTTSGLTPLYKETSFIGGGEMAKYVQDQDLARKIVNKINAVSEEKQSLINNRILVRAEAEVSINGKSAGTAETYIYAPGHPLEGKKFNEGEKLNNFIVNELGLDPTSPSSDKQKIERVGIEVDHIASNKLTRDPDGPDRPIGKDGNISGAPTLAINNIYEIAKNSDGSEKKDSSGNSLYVAKNTVGYGKYTLQGAVAAGILAVGVNTFLRPAKDGVVYLCAKKLTHLEHWVAGHNPEVIQQIFGKNALPLFNKLIWTKTIYSTLSVAQGKGSIYNNPVTVWTLHALIHSVSKSKLLAEFLESRAIRVLGVGATTGGIGLLLEFLWIAGELTYTFYAAKKKSEEEEKERIKTLEQEAIKKGCLPATYVDTDGRECIRCKPVKKWNPVFSRWDIIRPDDPTIEQIPVGIERDKNGDPIYEPDPITKLPVPKYIYPMISIPTDPPPPNQGPASPRRLNPEDPRDQAYSTGNGNNRNPLGQQTFTYTTVNPATGQSETIAYAASTQNASKESAYLGAINANYITAKNTSYVSELLNVTTLSNDPNLFQNQSANAGPVYNATSPAEQITNNRNVFGDNPYAEIEASKQRDRELQEKDKAWLGLLYSAGSSRGGGGNGGGGTLPPHENATLDSSAMIAGVPNVFMLDMGYDILYYYDGYATLIPKVDRPTIQYSSDGMG